MRLGNIVRVSKAAARFILSWLTSLRAALLLGEPLFWLWGLRRRRQGLDLTQVKRVLVVRLDEIGDVVMTTPLLRELRRNLPNAWITLIVKPQVFNLVELCPYVNELLTYDWNTRGRFWQLRRHGRALALSWKRLWRRRFDLAIVPRWDADLYHASFIAYFSGAPWRVGYSENVIAHKKQANSGLDQLLTHVLQDSELKHEVVRNLDVIRFLGGTVQEDRLELWIEKEDEAFAEIVFKDYGVQPGELVVAFGPSGGNSPLKQWPISRYIDFGGWLYEEYNARHLIIGDRREEALGLEFEHKLGSPVINMVGKTTLRQMAALLKRCDLYVGNDAGPMHVATAIGIPLVAIFGSSCPHRFGPWRDNHIIVWPRLPCSPCFQEEHPDRCVSCIFDQPHCMLGITVEQVKQAVAEQLQRKGVKPCVKISNLQSTIP